MPDTDASSPSPTEPLGERRAGKPVAPFEIEYELDAEPTPAVPLEVFILFRPRVPVEAVELQLSADEGLDLNPVDEELSAPTAGPDAPAEWRVVVLPLEEGVQRLRVYAEARVRGERQGRSIVIPIRVVSTLEADARAEVSTERDAGRDTRDSVRAADGPARGAEGGARGAGDPVRVEGSARSEGDRERAKREDVLMEGQSAPETVGEPGFRAPERIIRLPSSAPSPNRR